MSLVDSTYKKLMFAHQALAGSKLLELFAGFIPVKKKHQNGVFLLRLFYCVFLDYVAEPKNK